MSNVSSKEVPRSVSISNELKARNKVSPLVMPQTKPPPITKRMIELLSDINLSTKDIDVRMMEEFPQLVEEGWTLGTTRQKLKKYPILAKTAKEARAMLWREVGRSKIDGFKVISECLDSDRIAADGSREPDHKMRHEAAKTMLTLMGEDTSTSGAKTNISIGGGDHKIMIVTSDGKQIGDCV